MGQVDHGLNGLLQAGLVYLVDHDRQEDRNREGEQQVHQAQAQRVLEQIHELVGVEETLKVGKSDPTATKETAHRTEILERHHNAVHGHVVKQEDNDNRGQGQQVQRVILVYVPQKPFSIGSFVGIRCFLRHGTSPHFF